MNESNVVMVRMENKALKYLSNHCCPVTDDPLHQVNVNQGWQVSAKGGLNRGLNQFKPVRQKQVSAIGFCHCM